MNIDIDHAIRAFQTLFSAALDHFYESQRKRQSAAFKEYQLRQARDLTASGIHIRAAFYADITSLGVKDHPHTLAYNLGLTDGEAGREVQENPFDTTKPNEFACWENGRRLGHILFVAKAKLPTE